MITVVQYSRAQDTIYINANIKYPVRIVEYNSYDGFIKYQLHTDSDSLVHIMASKAIWKIVYEKNGATYFSTTDPYETIYRKNRTTKSYPINWIENDIRDEVIVSILMPGISYQRRIGRNQSLYARVYIGFSIWLFEESTAIMSFFVPKVYTAPSLLFGYRVYYERKVKNRARHQELKYISPVFRVAYTQKPIREYESTPRPVCTIGLIVGRQINYTSRLNIHNLFGAGYMFGNSSEFNQSEFQERLAFFYQIQIGFSPKKFNKKQY